MHLTDQQLNHLIQQGESENLEFKSGFNNELIETLVAFANTSGGKLLLGINDTKKITGVELNTESIQNWINEIKNKTSNTCGDYMWSELIGKLFECMAKCQTFPGIQHLESKV